jgi:hypothetical protein
MCKSTKWDPYLTPSTLLLDPAPRHKGKATRLWKMVEKQISMTPGKQEFFNRTQKALLMKKDAMAFDYTTMKNFCSSGGSAKKEERQVTDKRSNL